MKRIITLILIALLSFAVFAETRYTVQTNHGKKEVVIPEGKSELEVLLLLAENYYNLDYDHNELLEKAEQLSSKIDSYVAENKALRESYNKLIIDYAEVIEKYKKLTGVSILKGVVGVGAGMNPSNSFSLDAFSIHLGATLFEKISLLSTLSYTVSTKTIQPGVSILLTL